MTNQVTSLQMNKPYTMRCFGHTYIIKTRDDMYTLLDLMDRYIAKFGIKKFKKSSNEITLDKF